MMNRIKDQYRQAWKMAYERLNKAQKLAVDTIEGPVMTIAGPGTGKTQLLTVRIGNILMNTDVFPHNILCLTYTDAGAVAMRKRLESFIGPEAYNVGIYTFHAFCHSIIRDNMHFFGDFRDLQLVTDVEEAEIFRILIDRFDEDHPLKKLKGDEYYEARRLKNLFTLMKQEKWTASVIQSAFEQYSETILDPLTSPIIWGKSGIDSMGKPYKKGDFNEAKARTELERYRKGLSAAGELDNYNLIMTTKERYDYQDMILWVIRKFKEYDDLLAKYQERYQYIMVDEYQDTNGAQNELLFLLADYWEQPNLFIVGDDDQSIFRFQGANMNSIIDFKRKYEPVEIVLTENYRSSQQILDRAKLLIENNEERLANIYSHIMKDLNAANPENQNISVEPHILRYLNAKHEEVGIVGKISELHLQGVPYNKMAVIYTKHRTADDLVKYFSQKRIPINVKKRVNVLYENEVFRIIKILEYLESEYSNPFSGEALLFEILHYDFFGLSPLDLASISVFCSQGKESEDDKTSRMKWREIIGNEQKLSEAGVDKVTEVRAVSSILESWIHAIPNVTIQTLLEKIITESRMLDQMLKSPDHVWKLQLINTFFDYIKNEAAKVKQLSLKNTVALIHLMQDTNIEMPVYRIISNENGINFLSAHSAKGLEFDHVFIMRCNQNMWEEKRFGNDNYVLPPTLSATSKENSQEDDRRLFYVAMTRAKNYLYISYPEKNEDEKPLQPSKFVAEIKKSDNEEQFVHIEEEAIVAYKAELMKYQQGEVKLLDDDHVDKVLENFKISATSLNKYLKCKVSFYFENILRVPLGRSVSMGFGNAMHYALEMFFRDIEKSNPRSYGSVQLLLEFFSKGMEKYRSHFTFQEFDNYSKHGQKILSEYYQEYSNTWLWPTGYEMEYNISSTEYQGVPISGKLDRINIYRDHVSVTDYKTGRYDAAKLKIPVEDGSDLGGDYWRQIMFYKLLLEGDKKHQWLLKSGTMDFLEKETYSGKYKKQEFNIVQAQTDMVGRQLVQAYSDIKNHIFTPGCGEETCRWCNFVLRNMPVTSTSNMQEDDDDVI
jgi:DNA helicase-2/ATP-dependent DNA helicase PcrA